VYNVAAMPAEPSPESGSPEPVSADETPSAEQAFAPDAAGILAERAQRAAAVPRTELELNSPTPLTLRLLGVIFLATFLPWVAAKVACNVREAPPRQPPELSAEVLSRQPKEAAIELQQRAATGRYREAAEFARGDAARDLLAAEAQCQTDPKPCAVLRAPERRVATRAVLVARDAAHAEVRVESDAGGQRERYLLRLEPDTGRWYAVSRVPFAGELNEPVPVSQQVTPPTPAASAH